LTDLPLLTALLLVLISLPGGVLVTIALFAFTDLSPAEIAGTAIVTHIGTGIAGSLAFVRSGQLREPRTRRLAAVMSIAAIIGTTLGVMANARVSSEQFGLLLATFVMLIAAWVLWQQRARPQVHAGDATPGTPAQVALGGTVSLVSGLFGLGGPMISVPLMVLLGVPMLAALAAAQAQGIVISGVGAATYLAQGSISWPLVALTGVPELLGAWLGW
jgi:uncharacterized membrane protein YfcA